MKAYCLAFRRSSALFSLRALPIKMPTCNIPGSIQVGDTLFGHMTYSLNSLQGVIEGIILGTTIGVFKGHTRSLDYGSYEESIVWGFFMTQSLIGCFFV